MITKSFTGGEKFAPKDSDVVKIGSDGPQDTGHDPSETLASGDVDDIWNDEGLTQGPKEPKPNGDAFPKEDADEADTDEAYVEEETETLAAKPQETKKEKEARKKLEKLIEALDAEGNKIPIGSNVKIPVTVRGEEALVELQNIINDYSGGTDWRNKYNDLNRERQVFENDRSRHKKAEEKWNTFAKSISERIASGEPQKVMDAWEDLIEKAGADPQKFSHHLVKALMPAIDRYSKMSPQEQALYDRQVEIDARDRAFQRKEKLMQMESEERERSAFVEKVTQEVNQKNEAYGFQMQDFDKAFKSLQDLQSKGQFEGEIKPDNVYAYLFKDRAEQKAKDLLKKTAPQLSKDEGKQGQFVKYVLKHVMTDFWSNDLQDATYYEDLAKEYLAKETAKEVSRKVATSKPGPDVIIKRKPGKTNAQNPLKTTREVSSEDLSFIKGGHIQW